MRYGVVLHSSSHVVDRCSVIQSLSVSVTACAGYTPVQAVTGCVPVSVLVAVFVFLWELTPGRHRLSQTRGRFAVAVVELGVLVTATESSTLSGRNRLTLFQRESGVSSPPLSLC